MSRFSKYVNLGERETLSRLCKLFQNLIHSIPMTHHIFVSSLFTIPPPKILTSHDIQATWNSFMVYAGFPPPFDIPKTLGHCYLALFSALIPYSCIPTSDLCPLTSPCPTARSLKLASLVSFVAHYGWNSLLKHFLWCHSSLKYSSLKIVLQFILAEPLIGRIDMHAKPWSSTKYMRWNGSGGCRLPASLLQYSLKNGLACIAVCCLCGKDANEEAFESALEEGDDCFNFAAFMDLWMKVW